MKIISILSKWLNVNCNGLISLKKILSVFEPRCEKTGVRGFRPSPTQTELYSIRRWLKACHFGFMYKGNCTIRIAKTMALISCAVAKSRFSHYEAVLFAIKSFSVIFFMIFFSVFL